MLSGPAPPPIDPGQIRWFPNTQRPRLRRWMRTSGIIVAISIPILVLGELLLPGGLRFAHGWFFSGAFTALAFSLIIFGVGASGYRTEPLHFGISSFGIHRDVSRATLGSPGFIAWSSLASIRTGSGPNGSFVSVRTSDNRRLAFLTSPEGAEAAVAGYEHWRNRAQPKAPTPPPRATAVRARDVAGGIPQPISETPATYPYPAGPWQPNSLRRSVVRVGALLVVAGIGLVVLFLPSAQGKSAGQPLVFAAVPLLTGLLMVVMGSRFPDAVAISSSGFSVRTGGSVRGLPFNEVLEISSTSPVLECTLDTGRTVGFDSLGAREMRGIQDAYRTFRAGGLDSDQGTDSAGTTITWIKNPVATSAAAGFWGPIVLLVAAVVMIASLVLWKPGVYRSLLPLAALAALPSAFCVLTIGPYRRAPAAVGFTESGLLCRFSHRFYPASALVRLRWDEVTELTGRADLPRSTNVDASAFGSSIARYLTFRTKYGLVYTLGPVSMEIQHRVVRSVPATLVMGGATSSR